MRWLLLLVGGVFLVYGALEVPEGDCGEEAAETAGGPQEVGEFGDAGAFGGKLAG